MNQREKVTILGDDYDTPDGTCLRDYIHILDLVEAHVLALKSECSGAFNLGTGSGYSVKEVIEAARNVTGHDIPAEIGPRREGDPARLIAGAEKARNVLNWNPVHEDLGAIIGSAWAWHQAHPDGYEE